MAEALNNNFMTREEYRNKKQLDEARKAGNVPAEVDEEGKDINPHMPQYIMQAPWYSGYNHATLKHQRHDETQMVPIAEWYARGAKIHQATKYRKGACANCGAKTHDSKNCFARPRKTGAKFTNQDIQPDELVQDLKLDYDAKRDRWNGYDLNQYQSTIKEHEMYSEEVRKRKRQELDKEEETKEVNNQLEEDLKQEFGEQEEMGVVSQRDPKVKTMVRNLRQREDTAKYLINLDVNSAYYDPISRSMRENPLSEGNLTNKVVNFKGDNWYRYTGDAAKMIEQEQFVWEQLEQKGEDLNINTIGVPTGTFLGYKQEKNDQSKKSHQVNKQLLQKYGGEEHLQDQWQVAGVGGQSENYMEWTREGKIKRAEQFKSRGKSRYAEDYFEKGHTAVWGSWWNEVLGWGYACCWGTSRSEECLGEKGKKVAVMKEQKIKKERIEEEKMIAEITEQDRQMPQQPQQQQAVVQQEVKSKEETVKQEEEIQQVQEIQEKTPIKQEKQERQESTNKKKQKNKKEKKKESSSDSSESDSDSSSSLSSSSESSISSSSLSNSRSRSRSHNRKHKLKKQDKEKPKSKRQTHKQQKEKPTKVSQTTQQQHNYGIGEKDFANTKLDKDKLAQSLKKQKDEQNLSAFYDEKKGKYNSLKSNNDNLTLEDIEAYRLTQKRFDDPMAKFD